MSGAGAMVGDHRFGSFTLDLKTTTAVTQYTLRRADVEKATAWGGLEGIGGLVVHWMGSRDWYAVVDLADLVEMAVELDQLRRGKA
jgi:hypothetical protein